MKTVKETYEEYQNLEDTYNAILDTDIFWTYDELMQLNMSIVEAFESHSPEYESLKVKVSRYILNDDIDHPERVQERLKELANESKTLRLEPNKPTAEMIAYMLMYGKLEEVPLHMGEGFGLIINWRLKMAR